jgi:thiol:disulfide interchange protein DsbC
MKMAKTILAVLGVLVIAGIAAFAAFNWTTIAANMSLEKATGRDDLYVEGSIKLADLPLEQAIKQVKGNGKPVLVTFEDPNCPYCKELDQELATLENVTLYTFLYPVLSEDSGDKSLKIWCAADRAGVWNDWMLKGRPPSGEGECDASALMSNLEIGGKMGINGVPYMLLAD